MLSFDFSDELMHRSTGRKLIRFMPLLVVARSRNFSAAVEHRMQNMVCVDSLAGRGVRYKVMYPASMLFRVLL